MKYPARLPDRSTWNTFQVKTAHGELVWEGTAPSPEAALSQAMTHEETTRCPGDWKVVKISGTC